MQITFSGYTQSLRNYIMGALSDTVGRSLVEAWLIDCEMGRYTAPQITRIVEGTAREDAVFS